MKHSVSSLKHKFLKNCMSDLDYLMCFSLCNRGILISNRATLLCFKHLRKFDFIFFFGMSSSNRELELDDFKSFTIKEGVGVWFLIFYYQCKRLAVEALSLILNQFLSEKEFISNSWLEFDFKYFLDELRAIMLNLDSKSFILRVTIRC